MTVEEREDEREAISRARPGGYERVVNEQRLPAEGIGAADGEIRHAFTETDDQDSATKRIPSGEYAGEERDQVLETGIGKPDRPDDIRC
jgi:hypothetical protein